MSFLPDFGDLSSVIDADKFAEHCEPAAELARTFARAEAYEEGDYLEGLGIVVHEESVYLAGRDWKSHWIEYGVEGGGVRGTTFVPALFILRRAVTGAGLRLTESAD